MPHTRKKGRRKKKGGGTRIVSNKSCINPSNRAKQKKKIKASPGAGFFSLSDGQHQYFLSLLNLYIFFFSPFSFVCVLPCSFFFIPLFFYFFFLNRLIYPGLMTGQSCGTLCRRESSVRSASCWPNIFSCYWEAKEK